MKKVLVANRGEIAIRAFRAAYELGLKSVAVYAYEDRNSLHRQKADESYVIGEHGHPVTAYLDIDALVEVALSSGADAIYPGYGFLSENPALAEACRDNGITFVGPPAEVLRLAGNKVRALEVARVAGLPVLRTTPGTTDGSELIGAAESIGFPLFVKAAAGGGGRGLRRVDTSDQLVNAIDAARREAASAFGDETIFLEQAVTRPRHIEVQILGDMHGNIVHLYERDCSVQRRHQKVIEVAPAQNLDPVIRTRLCEDAVNFANSIGYQNAGTVEFLLDERGQHVFIEMNPRIQVEHTVTEEVTGVDLVRAQFSIAAGATLHQLDLDQEAITIQGCALQCRITTEDPNNDFRPDTGRISAYRSAGGAGIRLDGGTLHAGAEVLPYFDSMLVKMTARGRTWPETVARARRAVTEFRVRGVATNIYFLQAVLDNEEFKAGRATTALLDDYPELLRARTGTDRGSKLLAYLAEVTVNRPHGELPSSINPRDKLPKIDLSVAPPEGSRERLLRVGPSAFAQEIRNSHAPWVTDTTFRDAHQSLLATRLRTDDMLVVAPYVARMTPQLLSLEAWGGATYDVALRFLHEDPWQRLELLRQAVPNLCLQMLLRGRNTVGYTPYPEIVTRHFVKEAAETGIDIFRIFDALNDVGQMRPAIDAVLETHAIAEGALCYTSDLSDPSEHTYTLDYYLNIADGLVDAGVHMLCIKDMAGLLRPPAAYRLVTALRERFGLPVHLHTHDTSGGQLATYLAALEAGVDAIDGAHAPMAGTTSQPSLSAIVASTDHSEFATGIDLDALSDLEPYFESLRRLYAPFESGLPGPTGRVYQHEIPGGQLSNLRQQAAAVGLGDRFEDVERLYAIANKILGNIVKVTPSSKVVGDLALQLAASGADPEEFEREPERFDIPDSVLGFLAGELGTPANGFPEPFRTRALAGRMPVLKEPTISEQDEALLEGPTRRDTLSRLLFPGPTREYEDAVSTYGHLSLLSSRAFFYGLRHGEETEVELEPGVSLIYGLEAIGEADERGMRTVVCTLNGQYRPLSVRDRSLGVDALTAERADQNDPTQVAAPFTGVVTIRVRPGDEVSVGTVVATIEAMKMEAGITAAVAGRIMALTVEPVTSVRAGDLLLRITPTTT
ncbi:MAG TPA: pyruvate carboxylase [Acidimicrobiales bacterium]|nr:pyruvate carboxylase [Acidimicrobiales bacterium]